MVSTALDRASEDVIVEGISQGILVVGGLRCGARGRFVVEVVPHFFNRRRISEFADIDVRFAWSEPSSMRDALDEPVVERQRSLI